MWDVGDLKTAKLPSFIEKEDSEWKERKEIQGKGKGRALNLSCCRMGLPHCAAATTLVLPSCWPCVANAQKHSIAKDSGKLSNALNTLFRSSKNCQWRFATFINVSIRLKTFHTRSRTLATTSRKKAISFLVELWKAHKSFTPDWFNIVKCSQSWACWQS